MLFKKEEKSTTEIVNEIQNEVYKYLKPLGFRKHGRTFCRFVDTDIAQVIEFQVGLAIKDCNHCLWVHIGTRVPECVERTFFKEIPMKKFYHEYECNLRSELGYIVDKKDTYYDLRKRYDKYAKDIIKKLERYVIPVFDLLCSRDAVLKYRRDYSNFDALNSHLVLLEEAMIYGRIGNIEKATELFVEYYNNSQQELFERRKYILEKGILVEEGQLKGMYRLPDRSFASLPKEDAGHLAYLQELAKELNIQL